MSNEGAMLESIFLESSSLHAIKGHSHTDAVVVVPYEDHDLAVRLEEVLRVRAGHPGSLVLVRDDAGLGVVRLANTVYAWTSSPMFGYLAQDSFPGISWLKKSLDLLRQEGAGLMAFNDGCFMGKVAVYGLADRAWLGTLYRNALFHGGYENSYGDVELSAIARKQQAYAYSPECMMMQVDYKGHKKGVNRKDRMLFHQRAQNGFDGLTTPFRATGM